MISNIEIYNEYNYIYPHKQPMPSLQFLIFFSTTAQRDSYKQPRHSWGLILNYKRLTTFFYSQLEIIKYSQFKSNF